MLITHRHSSPSAVLWVATFFVAVCCGCATSGLDSATSRQATSERVDGMASLSGSEHSSDQNVETVEQPGGKWASTSTLVAPVSSQLDTAIAQRDECGVYEALAQINIPTDVDQQIRMLTRIGHAMSASQRFVDRQIRSEWATLSSVITSVVQELKENGSDHSVISELSGTKFQTAASSVEKWMDLNCVGR